MKTKMMALALIIGLSGCTAIAQSAQTRPYIRVGMNRRPRPLRIVLARDPAIRSSIERGKARQLPSAWIP